MIKISNCYGVIDGHVDIMQYEPTIMNDFSLSVADI